jgi:hypothetical protein
VANKRNKSRKQQRGRRPSGPAQPLNQQATTSLEPGISSTAPTVAPARPQAPTSSSRYASSVSGPRRGGAATVTTGTIDIDERVPYFGKDLRRIVITAAVMVVIIVGASFLLH